MINYGFVSLPRDIGKALLIGLVIAGFISALVPDEFFSGSLGVGIIGMLLMMAIGIPTYVCATASVPIAAALMAKGFSPGAALVFLMTGPATNAATIAVVWKTMGRKTAIVYLVTIAVSALFFGWLLDYIYVYTGTEASVHLHSMFPSWFTTASAILLLGILINAIYIKRPQGVINEMNGNKETIEIKVSGMSCTHCRETVKRALLESKGVEDAQVDLDTGIAKVIGCGMDLSAMKKKIVDLGYSVEEKF